MHMYTFRQWHTFFHIRAIYIFYSVETPAHICASNISMELRHFIMYAINCNHM